MFEILNNHTCTHCQAFHCKQTICVSHAYVKSDTGNENEIQPVLNNSNDFGLSGQKKKGSSGGRVVKLLTCGARSGVGFPASPLEFQRLVISCYQVAIWLKYR